MAIHTTSYKIDMQYILHVLSESLKLFEHVIDVVLVGGLVADDAAEEVGPVAERLVVHHEGATDHHLGLYASGHLGRGKT